MTIAREANYVWVTWLSKLMASEVQCTWAPWFRTHYTKWVKPPVDFDLVLWQVDHGQLLAELVKERRAVGEQVLRERQNAFHVRLSSTMTLAGTPDLIATAADGSVIIFDAKTGSPKQSDTIQMMLYMLCLPSAVPSYKGKQFGGYLVYANGQRTEIPCEALTMEFKKNTRYFANMLDTDDVPARSPSVGECQFCDIGISDCPEKIFVTDGVEIPDLDW